MHQGTRGRLYCLCPGHREAGSYLKLPQTASCVESQLCTKVEGIVSNENGPVTDTLASPAVSMCCKWNRTTRPKPCFPIPVSHEGSKAGNKLSPIQACFLSLVLPKSSLTLKLRPPALGERTVLSCERGFTDRDDNPVGCGDYRQVAGHQRKSLLPTWTGRTEMKDGRSYSCLGVKEARK